MRRIILLISMVWALFCGSSTLLAYTLTFDDVPIGKNLSYYHQQYGLDMVSGWQVINSVTSGWGTPQSGTQSVVWNGNPSFGTAFGFFFVDGVSEFTVSSVGAYFTTQPGVVLEMRGYTASGVITTSIGESNASWTNHYAEINSSEGILYVHISGLSSPDARYHFSMDDLSFTPIPEPSSFAALGFGILPLVGCAIRRRYM